MRERHRHQEWLAFPRLIDREIPEDLNIRFVCDNYAAHKHARVRAGIAKQPRLHLHFTAKYVSWLNLVERWFGDLSQPAFQRAKIHYVTELKQQIMDFTEQGNELSQPFAWFATTDSIFE